MGKNTVSSLVLWSLVTVSHSLRILGDEANCGCTAGAWRHYFRWVFLAPFLCSLNENVVSLALVGSHAPHSHIYTPCQPKSYLLRLDSILTSISESQPLAKVHSLVALRHEGGQNVLVQLSALGPPLIL